MINWRHNDKFLICRKLVEITEARNVLRMHIEDCDSIVKTYIFNILWSIRKVDDK